MAMVQACSKVSTIINLNITSIQTLGHNLPHLTNRASHFPDRIFEFGQIVNCIFCVLFSLTPDGVPVAISKTPNAIGPKIIKEVVVTLFILQFSN